jgi:hypothetical protein
MRTLVKQQENYSQYYGYTGNVGLNSPRLRVYCECAVSWEIAEKSVESRWEFSWEPGRARESQSVNVGNALRKPEGTRESESQRARLEDESCSELSFQLIVAELSVAEQHTPSLMVGLDRGKTKIKSCKITRNVSDVVLLAGFMESLDCWKEPDSQRSQRVGCGPEDKNRAWWGLKRMQECNVGTCNSLELKRKKNSIECFDRSVEAPSEQHLLREPSQEEELEKNRW